VVALLVGAWKLYNGVYFEKSGQSMTIKCHYMAYACGDCYPQWQIDSNFAIQKGLKELIEKDLYVDRHGTAIEELITDSTSNCMICYDFYFTGLLLKTLGGRYRFKTNNFKMELKFPDCCN
jgi:hypothetical protein